MASIPIQPKLTFVATACLLLATAGLLLLVLSNTVNGFMGFRWWSWHQKLTVEVQTPSGPASGSSVTEAKIWLNPRWRKIGDSDGSGAALVGEAAVVDLGSGKYLFALLKGYGPAIAMTTFTADVMRPPTQENINKAYDILQDGRTTAALPQQKYPLLVTFGDINDPASVKRVDPADLEAAFGPGYRLNSITLSLTDEPVTKGKVEKVLGWLPQYYNTHLNGNRLETIKAENRFANSLASGDFDTEKN